jgi:hypothetical protein
MGYSSTIYVIVENEKGEIYHTTKTTRGIFNVGIMVENIGKLAKVRVTGGCENDEDDDKISCGLYCFGENRKMELFVMEGTKKGVTFEPKTDFVCGKALIFVFTGFYGFQKINTEQFYFFDKKLYNEIYDAYVDCVRGLKSYEENHDNYCTVVSYKNFSHSWDNLRSDDLIPWNEWTSLIPNSLLDNRMYDYDIKKVLDEYWSRGCLCKYFLLRLINTKYLDFGNCKDVVIKIVKVVWDDNDNFECLTALLESRNDFDINYIDAKSKTALDYAIEYEDEDITNMLIKKGAKRNL